MQQTNKKKKMKENKSDFTWFCNFVLFDDATALAKNAFSQRRPYENVADCRYYSGKLA